MARPASSIDTQGVNSIRGFSWRWAAASALCVVLLASTVPAHAHQPVQLTSADSTPASGPLLVDGSVSFAVYASVRKGQTRGFRVGLTAKDRITVQLLIPDTAPANKLSTAQLPSITVVDPAGKKTTMKITERTPFFEPYTGTSYLYLSRLAEPARAGIYQVTVKGNSARNIPVVVGVGYREVPGEVRD